MSSHSRVGLALVLAARRGSGASQGHHSEGALGFNIGDDYQLATYAQMTAYCRRSTRNPTA